jgi:hypothetical protein
MRRIVSYILLITVLFVLTPQHGFTMGNSATRQCNIWIKTFFREPTKEQIKKFSTFNIEDQYSLFICGNQIVHPPALYLAEPFAANGKVVSDFLKSKLKQATDDLTIRDIIRVFTEMNRQGTHDVVGDNDLMMLIHEAIARMNNEGWKKVCNSMVERMAK